MDYEKFQGKVWRTGSSLVITLPDSIARYGSYQEGDEVKIKMKKVK